MLFLLQSRPIQELWKESYVAVSDVVAALGDNTYSFFNNIYNIISIVAISFLFVAYFQRIVDGFYFVFVGLFNKRKLMDIENQLNMQVCRNTLFIILLLIICFILSNFINVTPIIGKDIFPIIKFVAIFTICIVGLALRRLFLNIISWVNNNSIFKIIDKIVYTYAILEFILLLIGFLILNILGEKFLHYMLEYSIICSLVVILLYNTTTYRLIISNRFSHFFYILYLCTFEILPIAILWRIVFN